MKVRPMIQTGVAAGLTVAFAFASGWAISMDHILHQIEQKGDGVSTVSFDFKQDIHFSTTGQEAHSEGTAVFQKPNKLSVRQKQPQEQVTVTNGKKTWVYTPSFNQVWVGKGEKGLSTVIPKGMIPFQNVAEELRKNYDLSLMTENKTDAAEVRFTAVPKEKQAGYTLELVFSTESWLPKKTVYNSASALVVTTLNNYTLNPSLSPTVFEFTPPPGTDVIPF